MLDEDKPIASSKAEPKKYKCIKTCYINGFLYKAEPKKYKCIKTCYINGFLYKAGDIVTGNNPTKEYFVEIK